MMEWLRHSKIIKKIIVSVGISCSCVLFVGTLYVTASDIRDVQKEAGQIYISLEKAQNTFETGIIDLPKAIRQELMLYQWIAEALNYYAAESGDEEVFNFDIKKDILYGSEQFRLTEILYGYRRI